MTRLSLIVALCSVVAGCPAEPGVDAGLPGDDAPLDLDVPVIPDVPDAPSNDADMDGVVRSMDCDDDDPAVGLTGVRTCTSVCGEGMETCIAGDWSACSVGTECLCAIAGEMRTVPCPRCGTAMERCTGERWERAGPCTGLLDCDPATTETRGEPPCLQEDRVCDATCHWGPWTRRNADAICNPGTCRPSFSSPTAYAVCQADCRTEVVCEAPCAECPDICPADAECEPGALEMLGAPPCLEQRRQCFTTCRWGPWERLNPSALCNPGDCVDGLPPGPFFICGADCQTFDLCPAPCAECM